MSSDALSLSARALLVDARTIARSNFYHVLEPEHIFRALMASSFAATYQVFKTYRPTPIIRQWLIDKLGVGQAIFKRGETIAMGARASHILSLALLVAAMRGSRFITEGDLVLAFVYDGNDSRALIDEYIDDVPGLVRHTLQSLGEKPNLEMEETLLAGHGH